MAVPKRAGASSLGPNFIVRTMSRKQFGFLEKKQIIPDSGRTIAQLCKLRERRKVAISLLRLIILHSSSV